MATTPDPSRFRVSNYLVPAVGGCSSVHCRYGSDGTAEKPFELQFKKYSIDGDGFNPSGFFVTNHSADHPIYIKISGNNLVYEIPPGANMGRSYPAPFDHSAYIWGLGDGDIVFVNFPVIPYGLISPGTDVVITSIPDGADVSIGSTGAPASPDAVVSAPVIAILKGIYNALLQTDQAGDNLPADFDSLPEAINYAAGNVSTIVKTKSPNTWTKTFTYNASGDLTGISKWVKA